MGIPRPKILTAVTVPSGGWVLSYTASHAASLDVAGTCTIAAGTYFVAGDNQTDDFLYELVNKLKASVSAAITGAGGAGATYDGIAAWIDPDSHKVKIGFFDTAYGDANDRDFKIRWTATDGDDIAKVLGFDYTADDTSTGVDYPIFTADYQHAYAWYADEDGLLLNLSVQNESRTDTQQAVALTGQVKSLQFGYASRAVMQLQFLTQAKTWSGDVGYTAAPVYPYSRNVPLECWWKSCRDGTRFRVYRNGYIASTLANEAGTLTADNTTTLTDAGRAWSTEPIRFTGSLLWIPSFQTTIVAPQGYYINSNTATVLTVANAHPSGSDIGGNGAGAYQIYDNKYDTYVIDFEGMKAFAPDEIEALDRYNLRIPLLKYVA